MRLFERITFSAYLLNYSDIVTANMSNYGAMTMSSLSAVDDSSGDTFALSLVAILPHFVRHIHNYEIHSLGFLLNEGLLSSVPTGAFGQITNAESISSSGTP
jgi:hypothetical protein